MLKARGPHRLCCVLFTGFVDTGWSESEPLVLPGKGPHWCCNCISPSPHMSSLPAMRSLQCLSLPLPAVEGSTVASCCMLQLAPQTIDPCTPCRRCPAHLMTAGQMNLRRQRPSATAGAWQLPTAMPQQHAQKLALLTSVQLSCHPHQGLHWAVYRRLQGPHQAVHQKQGSQLLPRGGEASAGQARQRSARKPSRQTPRLPSQLPARLAQP